MPSVRPRRQTVPIRRAIGPRSRTLSTPEGTRYNWRLVSLFVYVVVLVVLGIASRRRDRSLVSDVPRHSGVRWLRQFAVQDGKNRQIAISADGSHVAAAVRSEAGLTIQIWSTADGRLRDCWPVPDWTPSALALSANGQFAACGLFRRRPDDKAWEAGVIVLNHPGNATGIDARIAAGEQVIASLAFSPDASRLAILAPTRLAVHNAPIGGKQSCSSRTPSVPIASPFRLMASRWRPQRIETSKFSICRRKNGGGSGKSLTACTRSPFRRTGSSWRPSSTMHRRRYGIWPRASPSPNCRSLPTRRALFQWRD